MLASLSNAGITPKDIRTFIRQNSSAGATQQDIYNRIADIRRGAYEGQSSIYAFVTSWMRKVSGVEYSSTHMAVLPLFCLLIQSR